MSCTIMMTFLRLLPLLHLAIHLITTWGIVADACWEVVLHFSTIEEFSRARDMTINGRRSDAQECYILVNPTRFCFLERTFDVCIARSKKPFD